MFKMKQSVAAAIVVCNYSAWKVEKEDGELRINLPYIVSSRLAGLKMGGWMDGWTEDR